MTCHPAPTLTVLHLPLFTPYSSHPSQASLAPDGPPGPRGFPAFEASSSSSAMDVTLDEPTPVIPTTMPWPDFPCTQGRCRVTFATFEQLLHHWMSYHPGEDPNQVPGLRLASCVHCSQPCERMDAIDPPTCAECFVTVHLGITATQPIPTPFGSQVLQPPPPDMMENLGAFFSPSDASFHSQLADALQMPPPPPPNNLQRSHPSASTQQPFANPRLTSSQATQQQAIDARCLQALDTFQALRSDLQGNSRDPRLVAQVPIWQQLQVMPSFHCDFASDCLSKGPFGTFQALMSHWLGNHKPALPDPARYAVRMAQCCRCLGLCQRTRNEVTYFCDKCRKSPKKPPSVKKTTPDTEQDPLLVLREAALIDSDGFMLPKPLGPKPNRLRSRKLLKKKNVCFLCCSH